MRRTISLSVALCLAAGLAAGDGAGERILMASSPAPSPDGARIAFAWRGDLWVAPRDGGAATQLTKHPAADSGPFFSPDGREIAFVSERNGCRQVFVMPSGGGEPAQVTFDTDGATLHGWFPDGESLLVTLATDRHWRRNGRFFRVPVRRRAAPEMLFDAYGGDGDVSPDGTKLLFTREGVAWWRKGYRGSQAAQVWLCDLETGGFRKVLDPETGARWPRWLPDGTSFLFVGVRAGAFNLARHDLETGATDFLTAHEEDSVVTPAVSRDGRTVVYRHLFDLHRLDLGAEARPVGLALANRGDRVTPRELRRAVRRAEEAAFSADGLEVAFTAGGDLFVMDTLLREPVRVTDTPEEESAPVFTPDGDALLFVSERDGRVDVWRAVRSDPEAYWWRNREFALARVTDDEAAESLLTVSPDGGRIAFVRGRGKLVVAKADGGDAKVLVPAFEAPRYAWSPDGRWIAYAANDDDFNVDVWIVPADGSAAPVNVSRHPDDEGRPAWSPDGRLLAFPGRRAERETDIHYVWLRREDDERSKRDRTLEEALEVMRKAREKKPGGKGKREPAAPAEDGPGGDEPEEGEGEEEPGEGLPEVEIDFEGIHERVRRISIPGAEESGLFWSPDSKRLAFRATVDGTEGTFAVEIPGDGKPALLTETIGDRPRWIEDGDRILWLSDGRPAVTRGPKTERLEFTVRQTVDRAGRQRAAFDQAWRVMRDEFYDERLNNRDWDAVRAKYRDAAEAAPDLATFGRVVSLMLGELNASHLGFSPAAEPAAGERDDWSRHTGRLGLRWDPDHEGEGLLVAGVVRYGPADREAGRIGVGETVLAVDGKPVAPGMDLTEVLNVIPEQEVVLRVRDAGGAERDVAVRPIALRALRGLLYDEWLERNRDAVHGASGGRLGYLHVRGMNWSSFAEFERMLYAEGCGRDGLVIDVRNNGGGFTTDHLLTALTQPVHAITVPRDGGPGYPQDRKVYATWTKPIVVLCNQSSFSNAEIFSHAIRTLGRGKLVGVPTAGGVISTGRRRIMDVGSIRTPGRGWFVIGTGEDMERNGAVPHHVVWPLPGEIPAGVDRQLDKAVEVLIEEVEAWAARPRPGLRKASER